MAENTPLCFVVGPIGAAGSSERKLADFVMKLVIKDLVGGRGYRVKRADDDARPGSISQAVIRDILEADLVIADLTGFNPNAFYELGIRHSTGLPTIHLIAENVKLPFDNIDQRTIFIDPSDADSIFAAREKLKSAISAIKEEGYSNSNPVTQARGGMALAATGDSRDQQLLALEDRVRVLETAPLLPGPSGPPGMPGVPGPALDAVEIGRLRSQNAALLSEITRGNVAAALADGKIAVITPE